MHLCLALSATLLNHLLHKPHYTVLGPCCLLVLSCCWYCIAPSVYALHHSLLLCASSYHLSTGTVTACKSIFTASLHLLLGPQAGRDCGNQLNNVTLGILWSGILAKCPSHSSLLFLSLVAMVSVSPHHCLTSSADMCSSHCCLLEMPNTVRIHR